MLRRRAGAAAVPPPAAPAAAAAAAGAGALAAALVAAVVALLVTALGAQLLLGEAALDARVAAAFEASGARAGLVAPSLLWDKKYGAKDARAGVPRQALATDLAALLHPASTDHYALVVGESGTGKSTAVRDAVRALPWPKGALYFSAPEIVTSFSGELARAVDYAPPFDTLASVLSWLGGQAPAMRGAGGVAWPELSRALQAASARFHAKHGRPAVLIIDAADYVAKKDPAFFADLQDFAKVCADAGALRVVFVSSEGAALPLMRAASAWSRALPPYEVRDIDDAPAVAYLVGRGVESAVAEEAVRTLTGGRFSLLLRVPNAATAASLAALRRTLDARTNAVLKGVGLDPAHALFRALLADGRLMEDAALDLAPAEALAALLRDNVLALHPDGAYTVHARHVERFLAKMAGAAAAPHEPAPAAGGGNAGERPRP
jgi:hypothetical protein